MAPTVPDSPYRLHEPFPPAGDQPEAIDALTEGVRDGLAFQTLLGVTGSGKTYTMAQVIARLGRPALVLAPNKTLAAQLYAEFREFFPENAVEYFVSYYDYYQPEAYVPARDLYIEKDSSINEHIEQMRLSATKSLMERRDVVIVATVSAIYGIGDPSEYHGMILHLRQGEKASQRDVIARLVAMQYERNELDFRRGTFRVRGDVIDVFPAEHAEHAVRISLADDGIEQLQIFDPLTGHVLHGMARFTVYPSSHYVTPRETTLRAIEAIKAELRERIEFFHQAGRPLESQRIEQRTRFDLEMLAELGFCKGIENYSRHLSGRKAGEPPPTLIDYLPRDALMFIDESHVTIGAARRHVPGRPRAQGEPGRVRVSAAVRARQPPAAIRRVRGGGAPDRLRFGDARRVRSAEIRAGGGAGGAAHRSGRSGSGGAAGVVAGGRPAVRNPRARAKQERVLVTTLTKRMAEELTEYLAEHGVKVRYLHSEIETVERVEIIRDLRLGEFDVLVGINLLREGLDLPEVSLVAILDADKEGFLRSERSLIQTIGRAARHLSGRAILYADVVTDSMRRAIDETERRRAKQQAWNEGRGIVPKGVSKRIKDLIDGVYDASEAAAELKAAQAEARYESMSEKQVARELRRIEKEMIASARNLEFEKAARLRDQLATLKKRVFGVALASE